MRFFSSVSSNLLALTDNFIVRLTRLVAPKACVICGSALSVGESVMCASCCSHLPRTRQCESPYDNDLARLLWGRMPVERAAALMYFERQSEASRLVYSFKYRNHPEYAEHIGRMAAKEMLASGFFSGIDTIVPVPLAPKRQRARGYNQSERLAKGISGITGIPIDGRAVIRHTFVESQTQKSYWQRMENVATVFTLRDKEALTGKHVLIVDDVVTTGATMVACANEIAKSEGTRTSVFAVGFAKS